MGTIFRQVDKIISGQQVSDGAGVRLKRYIGGPEINSLDPFLLFDNFESTDPNDYIGGFPPHPHRGFETVTYLLAGRMRHKDNAGHEGVIEACDIQWMSAGRGIIHSEMPEQEKGLLQGFQLWVNLPAKDKMMTPAYHEYPAPMVPIDRHQQGATVKVIAGMTEGGTTGVVKDIATAPLYMDINLKAGSSIEQSIPEAHNAFIYVIEGAVQVGGNDVAKRAGLLQTRMMGILGQGNYVRITAESGQDSRLLLIAGRALNEPIARRGPFVMNTQAELLQAYNDYQNGKF